MHCRHTRKKTKQLWAKFLEGCFLRTARQTIIQGGDEVLRIFNLKSFSPSSLILQKNWKHVEQHGWYAHLLGKPGVNSSTGAHQGYPPFQPCNFDVLSPNCLKIQNILNKVLGMPLLRLAREIMIRQGSEENLHIFNLGILVQRHWTFRKLETRWTSCLVYSSLGPAWK